MFKFLSFFTRNKEVPVSNSKARIEYTKRSTTFFDDKGVMRIRFSAPIDYKLEHYELAQDYHDLSTQLFDATSEKIDLLQKIDRLEAENARLGNGLVEITQQVTTGANATVKRMAAIALASLKVDA